MESTPSAASHFAPRPKGSPTALAELLAAFREGARKVQARGLFGAARGYALIRLAEDSKRPLVCVEPDEEAAEALERDLRFFARDRAVVRIPGDEVLPYEGLTPDRFVAQQRLAALFRLHLGEQPIVVCSIKSVGRRVLPRAALDRRSLQISLEMEHDRDELARKLTAAGYARVPLVDDPGTFAIRGGVFDVWSPLDAQPARLEFFGDLVEKIRSFDPQTQRTSGDLKEISLCPAREIVLDEEGRRAAVATVRAAADAVETPSRQLRELIDDLSNLSQDDELFAAGLTAILPGFYPGGLSPLTEYLPKDAIWILDDPLELERQWGDLWRALEDAFTEARRKGELALPPDQHFVHERDLRPTVEASPLLELSDLAVGADAAVGTAEIDFELQPTRELRAEIQSHHGEDGALTPLVRRLESLRERGATAIVACHSSAQAERTRRLFLDRNLMAQIVPLQQAAFSPHIHAHLVVGEISAGFVDSHERFALYSDEDIFGPRAEVRRAPRKPRT
ncbi:MAG: transcription-repair coupling factor, partial [Deltaproteobacteria bacterium]